MLLANYKFTNPAVLVPRLCLWNPVLRLCLYSRANCLEAEPPIERFQAEPGIENDTMQRQLGWLSHKRRKEVLVG